MVVVGVVVVGVVVVGVVVVGVVFVGIVVVGVVVVGVVIGTPQPAGQVTSAMKLQTQMDMSKAVPG